MHTFGLKPQLLFISIDLKQGWLHCVVIGIRLGIVEHRNSNVQVFNFSLDKSYGNLPGKSYEQPSQWFVNQFWHIFGPNLVLNQFNWWSWVFSLLQIESEMNLRNHKEEEIIDPGEHAIRLDQFARGTTLIAIKPDPDFWLGKLIGFR